MRTKRSQRKLPQKVTGVGVVLCEPKSGEGEGCHQEAFTTCHSLTGRFHLRDTS